MPEHLSALPTLLRRERVESLVKQAELIRDFSPGMERTRQAEILVREAMVQRALSRLTHEEESRIFSILNFVMPKDAPMISEPSLLDQLEESHETEDESDPYFSFEPFKNSY